MLIGGLILVAVGVVLMLIGRGEAHRWVLYAGLIVTALGVILLVVYVIDASGADTDTAMIFVPPAWLRGAVALLRRLRARVLDELRALTYDVVALLDRRRQRPAIVYVRVARRVGPGMVPPATRRR